MEVTGGACGLVVRPLAILARPMADGCAFIVSTLAHGVSPCAAGNDHLSPRLVARGLHPRGAVLLLWAAGFVAGWPALIVSHVDAWAVVGIWTSLLLSAVLGVVRPGVSG